MITLDHLPETFNFYKTAVVCSNTLIGNVHVVAIDKVVPFLIGKGEKPRIWLQAIAKPNTQDFVTVVEDSVSKHPAVKIYGNNNGVIVEVNGITALSAEPTGPDSVEVSTLDLRPLGLNLHGDRNNLSVGASNFSNNTISGGKVFIALGK